MLLQISLQVVLPAVLVGGLWRGRFAGRREWVLNVLVAGAVVLFLFLTARWDLTSYYLRLAWPLLLLAAAGYSYRRVDEEKKRPKAFGMVVNLALVLVFVGLSLAALRGYPAPGEVLQLASPLKGGTYYVGGGGNARLLNNHQAVAAQRFALDVVRLNAAGNRATGLAPTDLGAYAIFGDTVYSPCAGTVLAATDGLPDLPPPERDGHNLAGNHVVLACGGAEVVLAHLKQGSVAVAAGDTLAVGAVLGKVGNSGNTSQPHLHLHAEKGGTPGVILDGAGVPIALGGRFLVRNSLFRGP